MRVTRFTKACGLAALFLGAASLSAQTDAHALAQRIDNHYNHLTSLRTSFTEHYTGMGQDRQEHGTLLLKKPGRMRWDYADGKLFVLDGKSAVSYSPGDVQAQRVPEKQLDDLRSPLRFLLGHTRLEKELDQLSVATKGNEVTVSGTPRSRMGSDQQRIQRISVTADAASGTIQRLQIVEVDGTSIEFRFTGMQENIAAPDSAFRFEPPAGVTVVDGLPPA